VDGEGPAVDGVVEEVKDMVKSADVGDGLPHGSSLTTASRKSVQYDMDMQSQSECFRKHRWAPIGCRTRRFDTRLSWVVTTSHCTQWKRQSFATPSPSTVRGRRAWSSFPPQPWRNRRRCRPQSSTGKGYMSHLPPREIFRIHSHK